MKIETIFIIRKIRFFREMLIKIFEKHKLSIDTHHICLRSAPTLPLSLNQPVKHLLLNDLIVTGMKKPFRIIVMSFVIKTNSTRSRCRFSVYIYNDAI